MRSYNATLEYMFGMLPMFQRQGTVAFKKNLDNTLALLGLLGNPHQKLKCIHIAGTNGKGSSSHYIASILQEHGYQVGMYTSPHYKDFRERIKINGHFISKREVQLFIDSMETAIADIRPSFFELTVAMAFDYFARHNLDYVVVETGLGGRLDSTNVVSPLISLITNIGYDHQNMLGDTLPEIAGEKAGIIKHSTPVIIAERQESVEDVFRVKAHSMNASIQYADEVISSTDQGFMLVDKDMHIHIDDTHLASYQLKNIKGSLATFARLSELEGIEMNHIKLQRGIRNVHSNTYFIGRWMVLGELPLIIGDSAHNVDGMTILIEQIQKYSFDQLHIIIGVVDDKSHDKVFNLLPKDAKYYFCKADIPRGMNAQVLKAQAKEYQLYGKDYTSVKKAYAAAKMSATSEDLILVCGSIFVLSEVL